MAAVYTGPCLSLRGGGASAGRKEARKRKFQQMSGLDASSSDREAASRRASAEEIVDEKSRAIKQQDHDANRSVSSPDSAEDARSAEADGKGQGEALEDKSSRTKSKNQRFVVFIGNLPYTATNESIRRHFASLKPTSIRHRYEPGSGKSRGFAFLEFSNYVHMKTCLKRFHHSAFDDGVSPARKLNIELTVGGGGSKSKDRRTKLKARNENLRQERERRALNEGKTKKESTKKARDMHKRSDHQDVHPSRRTRVR